VPVSSLQAAVTGAGILISLVCLAGVFLPAQLLHAVRAAWEYRAAMSVAITVRLGLGLLLVLAAPEGRFPPVFALLGWLAIAAGLLVPLAGRKRILRMLDWWAQCPTLVIRLWSLAGVAFGAFLLYGATP